MNTWFASSVQHSGRKNKYPAVKSALLLLFLVFRWWIVHQKLARELHFSRYIYTYSRRTRSFRIPCIGRIKFVHERNGLRFLKLRWSRALVLFPLRRRKIFFPLIFPHRTPFFYVFTCLLRGWLERWLFMEERGHMRGIRSSRKRGLVKVWSLWLKARVNRQLSSNAKPNAFRYYEDNEEGLNIFGGARWR